MKSITYRVAEKIVGVLIVLVVVAALYCAYHFLWGRGWLATSGCVLIWLLLVTFVLGPYTLGTLVGFDRYSTNVLLGQAMEWRTYYWELRGVAHAEAKQRADQEVLASLRENRVDLNSYAEVRDWLSELKAQSE